MCRREKQQVDVYMNLRSTRTNEDNRRVSEEEKDVGIKRMLGKRRLCSGEAVKMMHKAGMVVQNC